MLIFPHILYQGAFMQFQETFDLIMKEGQQLVLATSVDNRPNVRIMSYYYEPTSKSLFVSTFDKSAKVKEIEANDNVAFSIQFSDHQAIRVNNAKIHQSQKTIEEVKDGFIAKDPSYANTSKMPGMLLYEIDFNQARVIAGFKKVSDIEIS